MTKRYLIYAVIGGTLCWLFYLGREALSPFILAAIFSYLLNPVVSFLSQKSKLPRSLSIIIVYIIIVILLTTLGFYVGRRIVVETREFASEARSLLFDLETGRESLPSWLTPYTGEISQTIRHSITISSQQVVRLFSGAMSSLLNFFIFVLALFYFLKEGRGFLGSLQNFLPADKRAEFSVGLQKVNRVLGNYFLAQFSLVGLMAVTSTIIFSALGVRYALILGIIVGPAELIPIIGPTAAFISVVFVGAIGGGAAALDLPIYYEPLLIGLVYLLLNQLENILVVPQVTGRMVRLHPLVILVSVLLGGHLFGATGFLLAVPLVASIKVILEHVLEAL